MLFKTRYTLLLLLFANGTIQAQTALPQPQPEVLTEPLQQLATTEVRVPGRFHATLEYLYWYMRDLQVQPLVTTGPVGSEAVYGQPGTQTLRGDGRLPTRHTRYIGIRGGVEWWLPNDSPFGIELNVTIMERNSSNQTYEWYGVNPLARPYRDAADGAWRSYVVAGNNPQQGPLSGSINIYSRMELFHEDINAMLNLRRGENWNLNLLIGAHFIQFRERIDLTDASRILPAETTVLSHQDHIQTFSKFFGGQIGLKGDYTRGPWTFDGRGTLALGGNAENIRAKGFSVNDGPTGRIGNNYGLLILPSNTGSFSRVALNFVTEWNANLTYNVTPRIGVRVGYTLLTWSSPVRPGDQIEPVNLNQVNGQGPAVPTIPFRTDFFWAQGINLGLDFKY